MTMSDLRANGIQVPGWLVGAVVAAAALVSAGYAMGDRRRSDLQLLEHRDQLSDARIEAAYDRISALDFRLCRIERALNIAPYQSCYPIPADNAGNQVPGR